MIACAEQDTGSADEIEWKVCFGLQACYRGRMVLDTKAHRSRRIMERSNEQAWNERARLYHPRERIRL